MLYQVILRPIDIPLVNVQLVCYQCLTVLLGVVLEWRLCLTDVSAEKFSLFTWQSTDQMIRAEISPIYHYFFRFPPWILSDFSTNDLNGKMTHDCSFVQKWYRWEKMSKNRLTWWVGFDYILQSGNNVLLHNCTTHNVYLLFYLHTI